MSGFIAELVPINSSNVTSFGIPTVTEIDWAAVEAIAAVAGVIGVVISIVFLIYEVRHNARAIEGSTVQSLMSLEREVFSLLAENAELMTKGAWSSETRTCALAIAKVIAFIGGEGVISTGDI